MNFLKNHSFLLSSITLLFISMNLFGQQNFTAEQVELTPLEMAQVAEIIDDPSQIFTFDIKGINEYLSDDSENEKSISFTLMNGQELQVTLAPHSILAPNCILNRSTANGLIREPMPQINSFRGTLDGQKIVQCHLLVQQLFFH